MYLVFDTETTGLPASWKAPVSEVDNWPQVVSLAWEAFDTRGLKRGVWSSMIRPERFKIPKEAESIHGISTRTATRIGVPVKMALNEFMEAFGEASVVVAHNLSFDASALSAERYRLGIQQPFRHKTRVCTKEAATDFCAIPGPYGFKCRHCTSSTPNCSRDT